MTRTIGRLVMIADQLENWRRFSFLTGHPIWREAFEWIQEHAATANVGFTNLSQEGFLVRVMTYPLKQRDVARFESHRNHIDLQYTISGAESIEWHPVDDLTPLGDYLPEKDFQYYETPARAAGRVDNREGSFCILFPGDGHMPQGEVPGYTEVRKLVVKIPVALASLPV